MKTLRTLACALCLAAGSTQAAFAGDIVDTAASNPDFRALVNAVQAADLAATLKGPGPFTVFAPTNAAFDKVSGKELTSLMGSDNERMLSQLLQYHVVPGRLMAKDLRDGQQLKTVQGGTLTVNTDYGPQVNNATIVTPDIVVDNGVIHVVDTVIFKEEWKDK